jgi:hypothetical protein
MFPCQKRKLLSKSARVLVKAIAETANANPEENEWKWLV